MHLLFNFIDERNCKCRIINPTFHNWSLRPQKLPNSECIHVAHKNRQISQCTSHLRSTCRSKHSKKALNFTFLSSISICYKYLQVQGSFLALKSHLPRNVYLIFIDCHFPPAISATI